MPEVPSLSATIVALTHDLVRKRSLVSVMWSNEPEKSVALPVPYGCSLDDISVEAEKAMRGLAVEAGMISINLS